MNLHLDQIVPLQIMIVAQCKILIKYSTESRVIRARGVVIPSGTPERRSPLKNVLVINNTTCVKSSSKVKISINIKNIAVERRI